MIRTAWVFLVGAAATVLLAPVVIVAGLFRLRVQRLYDWAGRSWSQSIMWASGCEVRIEGLEHIHMDEPQVLVGNHQSWFDVMAVAANLPKTFHFVAKKELEKIPLWGPAWKACRHISIDRSDRAAAVASLEQAGRQLKEERSAVVMFAEGTRSPTDHLLPFKKGPFMLALHSGVPVVPFGVAGSRRVFPKGSWRVRTGPIILRFGPPIPTSDLDIDDREGLMQRVRREVRRLRDGARLELGPGKLEAPVSHEGHDGDEGTKTDRPIH